MAAPLSAVPAPRDDKGNVLRALAGRVGRVLGAASACPNLARPRIKGVSDKITEVIKSSSVSEDESKSIMDLFNGSYLEGARAVNTKQVDCAIADRELADLESASAPAPQINAMTPAPQSATFATQVAPGPVHGVTDNEIRFGISAPFSGPAKDLGQEMRVGIETAFRMANEQGGVNGRLLKLVTADDGYEPSRTPDAMKQLYDQDQVFGFIGNVGTPTAAVAYPFALDRHALFFGAFTGASILPRDPPDRYVFNYRATSRSMLSSSRSRQPSLPSQRRGSEPRRGGPHGGRRGLRGGGKVMKNETRRANMCVLCWIIRYNCPCTVTCLPFIVNHSVIFIGGHVVIICCCESIKKQDKGHPPLAHPLNVLFVGIFC